MLDIKPSGSAMLITVRAVVEADGRLRLLEKVDQITQGGRVLVTIATSSSSEERVNSEQLYEMAGDLSLALASESALADYWDNPEEDEAWADL